MIINRNSITQLDASIIDSKYGRILIYHEHYENDIFPIEPFDEK